MDINIIKGHSEQIGKLQETPTKKEENAPPSSRDTVELGTRAVNSEAKPHKKWLFLNYIAADCNLTEFQLKNIDQQEKVGSDKNTHIAAFIDIGNKTNPFKEGWQNCRQYYIIKDLTPNKIKSELVKEYGPIDMANPNTLRNFVVEAMNNYPADHVALILNDHGGGFTGAMSDDGSGGFMSIPQIKQALTEAEKITGKKIDILGFDACLMAETEVAYELKDNARILLASEENEGGPGWTYDSMLGGKTLSTAIKKTQDILKHKINVGPEEFAKIVVDVNREHSSDIPTFSATDLTKINSLKESLNTLAKAIKKSSDKENIRTAIGKAESYGGGWLPYRDIHDLIDVCNKIVETSTDKNVREAAKLVINSVENAVIANANDPDSHPESHGLSIYAPLTYSNQIGYKYGDLQFARDTEWDEALLSLGKAGSGSDEPGQSHKPEDIPEVWPDGSPRKK